MSDAPAAPKISDQERQALQEQLEALGKAGEAIMALMDPFRKALAGIEAASASLLERFGGELAATCEGCSKILFYGEMAHRCSDGPTLCEACAPTLADCHAQMVERLKEAEDEEERIELQQAVDATAARIAAGGGENKEVYAL